ncbi:FecR domain-containing protein [Fulvivirgaceae bacterium PWU4]|uniref:FecR domain-containing protein n=1 Tax=Chryseosolibacter histidini TaxID=2782349 RepID=A0AAP2DIN4_9BACT|nr:FecR domain-containing protein [Chryseosolibacter histidini]MBT1696088.1 FecR domain-containing protein [Chryseosolibacter histidini]
MNTEMNNSFGHIDPELLVRLLAGECTEQERQTVDRWLEADPANRTYFKELSTLWNTSEPPGSFQKEWLKEDWRKVQSRIDEIRIKLPNKVAKQRSLVYTLARLAAVIVLGIGIYFFARQLSSETPLQKTIASAGMTTLILPDGSKVSLNTNAKLTYPETFDTENREVTLQGEAFFEITPDVKKPFLIRTDNVTTEVVGTSFSVNSNTSRVVVTVVTGKVMLYEDRHSAIAMIAGEQGVYNDKILEKRINTDLNFLSWKTNILTFQNTPLTKVVDDLNRHYGRQLRIASDTLEHCTLTSTFQHQTLEEILRELQVLFSIEIDRSDDTIILKGNGC